MNLTELFRTHKGRRSYDDLERACDGALTSQRLQQLATTTPKRFPEPNSVAAMARALGVSQAAVVLASAESLALNVSNEMPRIAQVLPSSVSNLSDDEVAALVHVIRAFKGEGEVGNDAGSAANTAGDQESGALVVEFNPKPPKVPKSGTQAARTSTQPPLAKEPDATED